MPPMTDVVKNLLIINVLFFLVTLLFGESAMMDLLALHYPSSVLFKPLQLVTHFFMHGGFMHIAFNMFALVMFGSALEAMWGPKKFLFFYFFSAIGAFLLHFAFAYFSIESLTAQAPVADLADMYSQGAQILSEGKNYTDPIVGKLNLMINIPMVGASGAIYGLLLGFGMKFPNVELMLIFLPIPIKAKYFIPVLILIELFLGFNEFSWDNIAHFAHLGGALAGFLLILYWQKFGSKL